MATLTGHFDKTGSPRIKIKLRGVSHDSAKEFEAIIDTGFTGFVSISLIDALPLGLVLAGVAMATLADGSDSQKLTASGTAILGGEEKPGVFLLNMGSGPVDVLIGMALLRTFDKTLYVHRNTVALMDSPANPP